MILLEGYKTSKTLFSNSVFDIHEGIDLVNDSKVLIKQMSNNFIAENEHCSRILIKEHETVKHCSNKENSGLCTLKDNGESDFLIYDINNYTFLRDYISTNDITFELIYSIGIEIARQLEITHNKGFCHYNLSPENILINTHTQQIRLINPCVLDSYDLMCDLRYIAPEQTGRVINKPDFRTDFYSLGLILYEIAAGHHPIQETEAKAIYRRQITDRFPSPDTVNIRIPWALSQIINKLTAKQAEYRYQNATALKFDLLKGKSLLLQNNHNRFELGSLDYISNISFPSADSFFEKEKEEIITSIKHSIRNKITIINISGTLSQGKDDFTKTVLEALDKWKIFNVLATALPSTGSISYYSVSNILKETIFNLFNNGLFTHQEVKNFFESIPNQHATVLLKLCPSISELYNIDIVAKSECISDNSILSVSVRLFINFICQKTHPFVIYIENIELMDNSSMKLFIELIADKELKNMVIMHSTIKPVSISKNAQNRNLIFKTFEIPQLTRRKILGLIQKTFKDSAESDIELFVDLLIEKTDGKVKQIYHLIDVFLKKKYISFNNEKFQWSFKTEKIREFDIKQSYELIIENHSKQLQSETLNLLIECSIIGYIFDLRILQLTHGYNIRSLSVLFREIYLFDFIEPVERFSYLNKSNNPLLYKFRNTKIHRLFLEKVTEQHLQHSSTIFSAIIDICKHDESNFFFFEEFIKKNQTLLSELSIDERKTMLQFYFSKADCYYFLRKYKDAEHLLNYCVSLIQDFGWDKNYQETTAKVYSLAMKTAIQTFYFTKSDSYFESVRKHITDSSTIIPFYEIQIDSLIARSKMTEATALLYDMLSIAKFYPKKPHSIIWKITSFTTQHLFNNKIINNTFINNGKKQSSRRKMLGFINTRSYNLDKHLYNYSLYKIRKDCIMSGIDKNYIFPLLYHAQNLIQNETTFERGIKLSTLLLQEIERNKADLKEELHYYSKYLLPFSNFGTLTDQMSIINEQLYYGEISKAIELAHVNFSIDFFKGINPKKLSNNIKDTIERIGETSKKNDFIAILDIIEQRTKLLTQVRKKIDFDSEIDISTDNNHNSLVSRWNNVTLMLCFFLVGEYEKAQICSHNVLNSIGNNDTIPKCIAFFYESLIHCETYSKKTQNEQKIIINTLKERLAYFKTLAKHNPKHFRHNAIILEAEYNNITENYQKAIQLYYEAITCSDRQNLYNMCGYSHKRLAHIYETLHMKEKAINHYIKSYNYYKFWGTETVANKIKFEHFSIFDELEIRIYNIS